MALAAAFAADAAAQPRKPPAPEAKEAKSSECAALGELLKAWDGQAFAIDGQTLGGTGLKAHLRIWGIQAPELRDTTRVESVPGMRARAFLADLLAKADHKVKCRPARFDRECRIVAQCSVGDQGDLGGSMIAGGMAYGFELDDMAPSALSCGDALPGDRQPGRGRRSRRNDEAEKPVRTGSSARLPCQGSPEQVGPQLLARDPAGGAGLDLQRAAVGHADPLADRRGGNIQKPGEVGVPAAGGLAGFCESGIVHDSNISDTYLINKTNLNKNFSDIAGIV